MQKHHIIAMILAAGAVAAAQAQMVPEADRDQEIEETTVTGTREVMHDGRSLPTTLSVVGHQRLEETHRASVLPTLTEEVPGLFSTARGVLGYGVNTGAGTMKVRGVGGMASLLVLVDGQPQYAGLMGHPIPDAYQTLLAERVEVLRGPASMLYGSNALGGVVNIVTREQRREGWGGNLFLQGGSYGTLEAGASARYKQGPLTLTGGYNFGRTDGHRSRSAFEQHTGFLKAGYALSEAWSLDGDVSVTYFNAENPGAVSAPLLDAQQEIMRGMAALGVRNVYDKADGALRIYYNWGHHHINDGYNAGGTPRAVRYIHDDLVAGASLYETFRFFKGNHTTFGVDYKHFGGEAYNRNVATREHIKLSGTDDTEFTEDELAGYVDLRQDITPWLTAEAGLRYDHHSKAGGELVPQGGLTFRLPRTATLRLLVSKGFRNPTLREMYMFRPKNADLEPERLMNYELSYRQHLLGGRAHVGANVFYLKADNLITTTMQGGAPLNVNTGRLENSGFELEGDYDLTTTLSLRANYSFLHMSRAQEAAPEHKAYLGARYAEGRFLVSTGLEYVAGLHTEIGGTDKENFLLWSASVDYRFARGLTAYVRGENLLAQKYEVLKGYPMPRATFTLGLSYRL